MGASVVDVESVVAHVIIINRCCGYISLVITQLFSCLLIRLSHSLLQGLREKHHRDDRFYVSNSIYFDIMSVLSDCHPKKMIYCELISYKLELDFHFFFEN